MFPIGSSRRRLLNQSTHSRVANSTASKRPPWTAPMDHLGLEQAVDRLGEGIVIGVAHAADRGLDAGLGEPVRVAQREVLRSPIRVVHEPVIPDGTALVQGLLQGVQHEARVSGSRHPPADDPPGKGVDHECHVDEARPGRDVGEVADPQRVGPRRPELAVDMVQRADGRRVGDGGANLSAPHHDPVARTSGLDARSPSLSDFTWS